jgi:hypothetical protein
MATPGQNPQLDKITTDVAQTQIEFAATTDSARILKEVLKDTSTQSQLISEYSTQIKNALSDTLSLASKLGTEYITIEQIEKRRGETQGLANGVATQRNQIEQRIAATGTNVADVEQRIEALLSSGVKIKKKDLTVDEYRLFRIMGQEKALKANLERLNEIEGAVEAGNKQFKDMNVKAAALSKIFGTFSGIPFLKDFMQFNILADAFKKGFGSGMKELGSQLKNIITNPLFLAAAAVVGLVAAFKALVKLAFDYDKLVTDIANNTALSKTSAVGLLDAYRDISNENAKTVDALNAGFLSVKNQANAFIELGETLETNAMFTNDMVQNQILLTKQMKMSKEEAVGIQKMSLLTGQSAEKILNTAMKQNTSVISYKKIFSEIAKVNSEIATAYKNNPELIAKAVVEANKLGMSLEQTKNISKSLLDFETSISGELESELLLGRRFNFEKARALALDGKSVEAASELMGQIGGINALTQMNVIQRERLAASIGMSAEELTKSAREQAVLNALGEQNKAGLEERYEYLRKTGDLAGMEQLKAEAARKEGGQALLQDVARANLQDRFNESMERIKQIFTEIAAGPMIKLLSGFAQLMEHTTLLKVLFFSLATAATAIAASMVIASGGTVLLGAAAAVAATGIGLGLMGGSAAGEEDMAVAKPTLPTRNTNLPTNNNNQQGNNAAGNQRSDEQRRLDISLNIDGKAVSTVMKSSDYSYS